MSIEAGVHRAIGPDQERDPSAVRCSVERDDGSIRSANQLTWEQLRGNRRHRARGVEETHTAGQRECGDEQPTVGHRREVSNDTCGEDHPAVSERRLELAGRRVTGDELLHGRLTELGGTR
jgi:hypothetical protein